MKTSLITPLQALLKALKQTLKTLNYKALISDWRNGILSLLAVSLLITAGIGLGMKVFESRPEPLKEVIVPHYAFVPVAPAQLATAHKALSEALKDQGIDTRVLLEIKNGSLYVSGTLTVAETVRWNDIQSWFDETYAQKIDIICLLRLNAPNNNRISFKAIYAGADAFVVSWTGERYKTGALLPEGWRIVSILPQGVTLEGEGRQIVISP